MEGRCTSCGQEVLFIRKPRYDGFTKIGESVTCSRCGADQGSGASPVKSSRKSSIFDDSDQPKAVKLFDEGENRRICRYCRNYLVNPFTQRCFLHQKKVEATDTCADFSEKPAPPPGSAGRASPR